MAGGRAAVPPEVVDLVADVRQLELVDDAALLRVGDGQEVGRVHTGALAEAGDVEELLGRSLHRLLRRAVEGSGRVVVCVHLCSFQPSSGAISPAARAAPSVSTGR